MNLISPLVSPDEVNVNVEVSGSTKYLQNPANKYVQNQAGVLTNPNDLQQNQEINNEEKKLQ